MENTGREKLGTFFFTSRISLPRARLTIMTMMRITSICHGTAVSLLLLILSTQSSARGQTIYAAAHDLRVAVSLPFIQQIVNRFSGMTYGARLEKFFGPRICESPAFYVWLERSQLSDSAWRSLSGSRGVDISLNTQVWAKLDDRGGGCTLSPREADCNLAASLQSLTVAPSFEADCNAQGYPLFRQGLTIPLPFSLEPGWTLGLKDIASSDAFIHPEFGHLEGNDWKSEGQTRTVDIRTQITTVAMPVSSHFGGTGLVLGQFQSTTRGLGALVADASVGAYSGVALSSLSNLESYLSSNVPLANNAPLGISIDSAFFGSASKDESYNWGLFGSVLPIRLSGKLVKDGRSFGIDVVLNKASATFFRQGSEDLMALRLGTSKARVWELDVSPNDILKELEVRLVTTLPAVGSDGRIAIQGRELRICMELALGSAHVCLDPGGLVGMLTGLASPIGNVKSSTTISPPACIALSDAHVKPLHPCPDPSIQSGLSYETPSKRAILDVDLSAIRSQVSGQTVSYVLPVTLR